MSAEFDFEKRALVPRDTIWTHLLRGKMLRRAETSETEVPLRPGEASTSELPRTSTAAASDTSTGERRHVSMTEEGPLGDHRTTMQRDHQGRLIPTKGERTMTTGKARDVRRNVYVGGSTEHETHFRSRQPRRSPLYGEFYLSRQNADVVSWKQLSAEEQMQFSKEIETEWQGVLDFKAVTIIDSTLADVIREKHSERVISSRLVLRWKETDTGYKAKARWCVHGFKDPDIHEIERSCPTPELSSINITLQIMASTTSETTVADGEKAFMQGDPSVRDEPLYATPPPEGLPGVPEGALIRLDREVYGLVSGMSGGDHELFLN